jgi:NADH:ubiquinone oxidoreductase subunit 2 (subunit N)
MGILFVIIGGLAIAMGIFGKEFYEADTEGFGFKSARKVPRWSGRTLFIVVGVLFIALGIKFLVDAW